MPELKTETAACRRRQQAGNALRRQQAREPMAPYFDVGSERDKVLSYFVKRAAEIGEACFRFADLEIPLCCLLRVLCEDFIKLYWITSSDGHLARYQEVVRSESAKMLRNNIRNERVKFQEQSTGRDVTKESIPRLEKEITSGLNIEKISNECGLGRVYDIFYRYFSLEVHGNSYAFQSGNDEMTIAAIGSGVNAFLNLILFLLDNRTRDIAPSEIIIRLNPLVRAS
jgi:hypothetical protein